MFRGLAYFDRRSRLSTWIYTIAHHVAIDHLRAAGRWRLERFEANANDEHAAAEAWRDPAAGAEAGMIRDEEPAHLCDD